MPNLSTLPTTSEISLTDVTLKRGAVTVFEGLTLDLTDRRIGLIGDNGAGKSSLFRLLCGLDSPDRGRVSVRGVDARERNAKHPGTVGMMFQNPDEQIIFPTVEEELALGLGPSGLSRKQAIAHARVFLAERGLAHWCERAVGSLSQGQRQHVCWLALMIATPQVLLLDEPYASLDLPGQALLDREIAQATQQVMVSTHVLSHIRGFDRVVWLDNGRVRADGAGHSVCAAYEADVAARWQAQTLSLDADAQNHTSRMAASPNAHAR